MAANLAAHRQRLEASLAQGDLSEGYDVSEWLGEVAPKTRSACCITTSPASSFARAELPEWRRWMEEFKPWLEGADMDGGVAVTKDHEAGEPDADGRYRSTCLERLGDVMDVGERERAWAERSGHSLAELLANVRAAAQAYAGRLLAYVQVIAEAGQVAHVSFLRSGGDASRESSAQPADEPQEDLLAELVAAASNYNLMAAKVSRWRGEIRGPRLPAFEMTELEPDEGTLGVLRERLAIGAGRGGLGANWWREAADG